MDKYTASNGYTVADGAATIRNRAGDVRHRLGKYSIDALREFFRAERDEELGRRMGRPWTPDHKTHVEDALIREARAVDVVDVDPWTAEFTARNWAYRTEETE